jgi:hypothetical protein
MLFDERKQAGPLIRFEIHPVGQFICKMGGQRRGGGIGFAAFRG